MRREIYSRSLKLRGEEEKGTLIEASNYALSLIVLDRYEEAKLLMAHAASF